MTRKRTRFATALPCLLLLAGCAETTFQDTLGIGKSAPDETKVRTVQPLSVPPDLDLRPPAPGNASQDKAAASATAGTTALAAPPAQEAPATGLAASKTPAARSGGDNRAPRGDFYDIYRKYGIEIYRPDGKRKPISQLNRELAERIREEKRRQNPNYGTIFNWGGFLK